MSVPDYLNELLEIKQSSVYEIISLIKKKQSKDWVGDFDKEKVFKDISLSSSLSVEDLALINKTMDDEAHHRWNKYLKHDYMECLYKFLISKGVKVTSENIKYFMECGTNFYKVIFKNVEENTQFTQDQLRSFMYKSIDKCNDWEVRQPEFYIKLGLNITIEDVKYCLKNQIPIKNIEQHSIIPSRELFDYCKSIPINPYYVYPDVPQTEIDFLKSKILLIDGIKLCYNALTLKKFKKMWKACGNIQPLDTQIVEAILNHHRLHADVVTYLLSINVEITNEQINKRLGDVTTPNGILWTLYYNKTK